MSINITIITRAPPFTTSDITTSQCLKVYLSVPQLAKLHVDSWEDFLVPWTKWVRISWICVKLSSGPWRILTRARMFWLKVPVGSVRFRCLSPFRHVGWPRFIENGAMLAWIRFRGRWFKAARSEDTMKAVDMPRCHAKFTRGYQIHHRAQVFSRSEGSHKNPVGIYLRMLDEACFVVKDRFIQIIRMILDYQLQTEVHIFMMKPLLVFSPIFLQ